MKSKKIIYGCDGRGDGDSPYLTRYTLLDTSLFQACVHIFHRSDGDELHDHPWPFVSVILWRGYIEETPKGRRHKWPGMILFRGAKHVHRVELVGVNAVTLVFMGPRERPWGFFTAQGWQFWRDYFREKGC